VRRGLIIGLVAGGVVIVLLWWFALYSPATKELDDTKTKTEQAESAQQSLEATLGRLQDLARNAPQQEAILRRLNAAVPETPDLADFIIQANQIASESGIDFLSIAPSPPAASTTGGTTSTISLSIQIKGGFFQVLEYLNRLEDLDRLVVVDTISLGGGDSGTSTTGPSASSAAAAATTSGTGTLSVTLTGRMFTRAAATGTTGGSTGGTTTPTTPGGTSTPSTSGTGTESPTTTPTTPGSGNS
jgi:Tfp pilus assembly protein PilO